MPSAYPAAEPKSGALAVLELPLHLVDEVELLNYIGETIRQKKQAVIPTLNIHASNFSFKYPWFREFFKKAHLVYCDSDGVRWGLRILGIKPPIKITMSRWIWRLAAYAYENHFSFYFLGGRKGVPEEARRQILGRFSELKIVGVHDNDFPKEGPGNEKIVEEINRLKPDIIIVGLGMPTQEKWIDENWRNVNAHVFMTAGATFEFLAKRIKMVPEWMARLELEWLFRLTQEPKRLFVRYVLGNPLFFIRILKQKWKQ